MMSTSPGLKPSSPQRLMPSSTATPRSARKIDQAAAIIAHFIDHHVVGSLAERIRHLVAIGDDGVADDLHGDGMGFYFTHAGPQACEAISMTRCPVGVTVTRSPGWIRMVEFGSSITTGPVISSPGFRLGRHSTRAL